jgi:Pin2-interacting protein X1
MCLAAPRNNVKISADPRNTHWANNTSNFGHRILTSHGWTPGSTLGDSSSSYHASGHITEASNTGVKIVLKGDNLGIGCKSGIKDDECTGLDMFQDLLGRLNGREEEVEKRVQQRKVEFASGRYGMKFVQGETHISSDVDKLLEDIRKMDEEKRGAAKEKEEERKRKKRERKAAKASKVEQEDQAGESSASPPAEELANKDKKKKEKRPKKPESFTSAPPTTTSYSSDLESRSKKRKRTDDSKKSKKRKRDKKDRGNKSKRSKVSTDIETPALTSGTITPTALTGRQAIRHRYIAAKRSAVMDTKALNEIFMIKA